MGHQSDPRFRVLHALRVKGFAKSDVLADLTGLPLGDVEEELAGLQAAELAAFREARALWQLTPHGRVGHADALAKDVHAPHLREAMSRHYEPFLELNEEFKELCGEWQLRDGSPNDHSDAAYDGRVIEKLTLIDQRAQPICTALGQIMDRFAPYGPRLGHTAQRVQQGEHNLFTGVMCGSYHDVWMELHEDLILTLGIDRAKEGSF
ncbi:MAG TPA: hypothetical protein VF855_14280 [Acidimicrobiales bacterium]